MSKQVIREIRAEENIRQEIIIQSKLNHPNILKFIEMFEDQVNLYIVLEYCSKGTLSQYLKKHGPLDENEAFRCFYGILEGLNYLHSQNVIHRDIKPENILFTEDNQIKICDFNWAVQLEQNQNASPALTGTTEYMPPEVVIKQPHNNKVDVWSLGIVFYEMLHCDKPYKGKDNKEKISAILANSQIHMRQGVSQDAQILIFAMLSRVMSQRPTSRQVYFSKWVKQKIMENNIIHPYDVDASLENQIKITKSMTTSYVKEPMVEEAMKQKFKSDVRPAKQDQDQKEEAIHVRQKQRGNLIKICGSGQLQVRLGGTPPKQD